MPKSEMPGSLCDGMGQPGGWGGGPHRLESCPPGGTAVEEEGGLDERLLNQLQRRQAPGCCKGGEVREPI